MIMVCLLELHFNTLKPLHTYYRNEQLGKYMGEWWEPGFPLLEWEMDKWEVIHVVMDESWKYQDESI